MFYSPNYEFRQDLFVLPLVTYKESALNTDLNDLIRQWQKTEDCCHYCLQSVELSHELPKCLLMLIEDTNFDPEQYKTLQIASESYELVSFTMHYGSMSGGHETCAAIRNGEWHLFDDSRHVKFDPFNKRQHARLVMYIQKEEEEDTIVQLPDAITSSTSNSKLKRDITWMIIVKWGLIILAVLFVFGFLGYFITAITPVAVLKAGAIVKRHIIRSWLWLYRRIFLFNAAVLSFDYIGENWRNFWTYVKKRFAGQKKETKTTARNRIQIITQSTYHDELYDETGILLGQ